jgi:hypothetical protein
MITGFLARAVICGRFLEIWMLRVDIRNYRCSCGMPIRLPVLPEFTDPFYVEMVKNENEALTGELKKACHDVAELAREALDYGVESSYLKKLDDMMRLLNDLKARYRID